MFKHNDNFFSDITDSQTIFIDMESGVFYVLPLFANLVFKLLLNSKTIPEIIQIFQQIPEIPSDFEQRIQNVYDNLIKYQLILESDTPDSLPDAELTDFVLQELQETDFAYKIEPSTDVQQLLLDDPIHDVSLDGWTPFAK
jgi:hypothetical protein